MSGSISLPVEMSSQDSLTSLTSEDSATSKSVSLDDRILLPVREVDKDVVDQFVKRSQCVERLLHLNRDEKFCARLGLWESPYESEKELASMLMTYFDYSSDSKDKLELCTGLARVYMSYPFELHHKLLRRYGRALFVRSWCWSISVTFSYFTLEHRYPHHHQCSPLQQDESKVCVYFAKHIHTDLRFGITSHIRSRRVR